MAYLKVIQEIAGRFDHFKLINIPQSLNAAADALAALASSSNTRRVIPLESISNPSIEPIPKVYEITHEGSKDEPERMEEDIGPQEDWRKEIIEYITKGIQPQDKWAIWRLRTRTAHYTIFEDKLYRWSANGYMMKCIHGDEVFKVLYKHTIAKQVITLEGGHSHLN